MAKNSKPRHVCDVADCDGHGRYFGLCQKHHRRVQRYGSPAGLTDEMRFLAKVEKTDTCWLWRAAIVNGYGYFSTDGKLRPAHRYSYRLHFGDFDESLEIDHMCHVKRCVNPSHLRLVTRGVNCQNHLDLFVTNTSGARNVTWSKKARKWMVQVGAGGVSHYGGIFDSLDEAAAVAAEMRARLHAPFPKYYSEGR